MFPPQLCTPVWSLRPTHRMRSNLSPGYLQLGRDWKPLGGSTMDLNPAFGAYVASLPGGFGSCGINPNVFSFFSAVVSPPQSFSKRQYQSHNTHLSDLFRSMSTQHKSAWSEWAWHGEHKQWGRYRLSKSEYEYEWRDPEPSIS